MTVHRCHAKGCSDPVLPRMLMCRKHWRMVPTSLAQAVWSAYREGQERRKDPSPEYLAAAQRAIDAVAVKEGWLKPLPSDLMVALEESITAAKEHRRGLGPTDEVDSMSAVSETPAEIANRMARSLHAENEAFGRLVLGLYAWIVDTDPDPKPLMAYVGGGFDRLPSWVRHLDPKDCGL